MSDWTEKKLEERGDLEVDPDDSPFEVPPIEGLPYEKGSPEDEAARRIIGWGSEDA